MQGEHVDAELTAEQSALARNVAAVAYAGASDTTVSSISICLLAMAMFPEVQKKAQIELDKVIGPSRLPEFDDLAELPYVKAVIMESLRWMPVSPLGVPHALSEDDEYQGYHIPKGTMVLPNVWAMMRNPEEYSFPEVFRPERFIGEDGKIDPAVRDPTTVVFGFGRRICPGSDFAMSLISISIASILHVFEVKPGVDESGLPVQLTTDCGNEAICSPTTFPRQFTPRSKQLERLVCEQVLDYEEAC